MDRLRLLILCLLLLPACDSGSDRSAPREEAAPAPPGAFELLRVGNSVRITGDTRRVELTMWRCWRPLDLLRRFPDPDEAARRGWLRPPLGDTFEFEQVRRLPRAATGLYLFEARRGGESFCRAAIRPGLRLVTRRQPGEVLVFVADAKTGIPVSGAEVLLSGGGQAGGPWRTDGSGVFRTTTVDTRLPVRVVAGDRGALSDEAVLAPPEALADEVVVFMDRPAYLPGDSVSLRTAILGRAPGELRLWPELSRGFAAYDAAGRLLTAGRLEGNPGGTLRGSFTIPPGAAPGEGRLVLDLAETERHLVIAVPGVAPASVEVLATPEVPLLGDRVEVVIRARDRFGKPAAGWRVEYSFRNTGPASAPHEPVEVTSGSAVLDQQGELHTGFDANRAGRHVLLAKLSTPAGVPVTGRTKITAVPGMFGLALEPDRQHCAPGETVRVVARRIFHRLPARRALHGTVDVGGRPTPFTLLPGRSATEVMVKIPGPGLQVLGAVVSDGVGHDATAEASIWAVGGDASGVLTDEMRLVADRRSYAPGDRANLLLVLPPGLTGARVFFTVEGERLGAHAVEQVASQVLRIDAEVPDAPGSTVSFRAFAVRDGELYESVATAEIDARDRRLDVELTVAPPEPAPGEEIEVSVAARAADGEPLSGYAALTLYDARLDEVRGGVGGGAPYLAPEDGRLAFWTPSLAVGAGGSALRVIRLPEREGRWRLRADVVGSEGRHGTATVLVPSLRPVSLRLDVPPFLVEGDRASARVLVDHRRTERFEGLLRVESRALSLSETISTGPVIGERAWELNLRAGAAGRARVRASLEGGAGIVEESAVPVLPLTGSDFASSAGMLPKGRSKAHLELPGGESAVLRVHLDLGPLAAVVRALSALRGRPARTADEIASLHAIHGALGRVAGEFLLDMPEELERPVHPEAVARLEALQHEDGGWGWCGEPESDPLTTREVLRALARLPAGDVLPEVLESAAGYLARSRIGVEAPAAGGLESLLAARRGPLWSSSRETAAACFRLLDLAQGGGPDLPATALVRVRLGRQILGNVRLSSGDLSRGSATFETPVRLDRLGRLTLHFEANEGGVVGWVAELLRERPLGEERVRSGGLEIEGRTGARTVSLGDVWGESVRIRSDSERSHVVVDCPFPAGAEPVRRAEPTGLEPPDLPPGTHVEFLGDRIRFRMTRLPAGETVLSYVLRAVREGSYRSLPATAAAAYSPEVRAVALPVPSLRVD